MNPVLHKKTRIRSGKMDMNKIYLLAVSLFSFAASAQKPGPAPAAKFVENIFYEVSVVEHEGFKQVGTQSIGMPVSPKVTEVDLNTTVPTLKGYKLLGATLKLAADD